ncbi:MAG: hypothetical protein IPH80_35825 [Myxococcales bacterium]|nr:hypothetical protein [Myxococcales bacterium]MBP6848539.1 hypothetical protein [Kofleriaceae bacterium]
MIRAVAIALLATWLAGCGTPRAAPPRPAAAPRTASMAPPHATNGGDLPAERRRRVRGAAAVIDLGDFGLDPDRPLPAPPAPLVIAADERATLDAIEAVARLFAQDLPPAEFHRRIGRNPTTIDGDVTLVPHDAPLTSIIAWSTTYQLTLRLRVPMPPAKMETRFGPFEVWRADNRENPSFNVMLTGSHAAFAVHLELMFPDPVGADWRDGPIDEVHLFRSPARHE